MNVLDAEAIASTQYCACIMRLEDILQGDGEVAGPESEGFPEFQETFLRNKLLKVRNQFSGNIGA